MSIPFLSLSAVSSAGAGAVLDLGGVTTEITIQASATGSPAGFDVYVQGSLDGSNWFTVPNTDITGPLGSAQAAYASTVIGNGDVPVSGSVPFQFQMPQVRFVRAYLYSLTGGTSPTLTAWISVGEVKI